MPLGLHTITDWANIVGYTAEICGLPYNIPSSFKYQGMEPQMEGLYATGGMKQEHSADITAYYTYRRSRLGSRMQETFLYPVVVFIWKSIFMQYIDYSDLVHEVIIKSLFYSR